MYSLFSNRAGAAAGALLAALSGTALPAIAQDRDALREAYRRPLDVPFPNSAPYSPQLATLGKMLFFDPRLSGAKNMSCASCHNPSFGYEVPVDGAVGAQNTKLGRHAPSILNVAWVAPFFWDGRAADLEEQAAGPITAAEEMNGNFRHIISDLSQVKGYKTWFAQLFPDKGITRETVLTAIATYERTVVSGWSPFDRWVEGDEAALSESQKRGFDLFNGKAKCSGCHTGWNFTDNKFHDVGWYTDDVGRAKFEPDNIKAQHAFKTPGLRNLTYRAPFMHNGGVSNLEAVIRHYETGGIRRPSISDLMKPIQIDDQERQDLISFLNSLTADKSNTPMPNLPN